MPAQPALVGDAQGKPIATDPISVAPPSPRFEPITVDPVAKAERRDRVRARPPTSRTSSA